MPNTFKEALTNFNTVEKEDIKDLLMWFNLIYNHSKLKSLNKYKDSKNKKNKYVYVLLWLITIILFYIDLKFSILPLFIIWIYYLYNLFHTSDIDRIETKYNNKNKLLYFLQSNENLDHLKLNEELNKDEKKELYKAVSAEQKGTLQIDINSFLKTFKKDKDKDLKEIISESNSNKSVALSSFLSKKWNKDIDITKIKNNIKENVLKPTKQIYNNYIVFAVPMLKKEIKNTYLKPLEEIDYFLKEDDKKDSEEKDIKEWLKIPTKIKNKIKNNSQKTQKDECLVLWILNIKEI